MTEQEKMLRGMIYDPSDKELTEKRLAAHRLCKDFNDAYEDEEEKRAEILRQLIPELGEGTALNSPIIFDYGVFTTFGKNCFTNFNLTVLDSCPVTIGNDVFFGPNCSLRPGVRGSHNRKGRLLDSGERHDMRRGHHRRGLGDRRGQRGHP